MELRRARYARQRTDGAIEGKNVPSQPPSPLLYRILARTSFYVCIATPFELQVGHFAGQTGCRVKAGSLRLLNSAVL